MLETEYTPDGGSIVTDTDNPNVRYVVWQDSAIVTDTDNPNVRYVVWQDSDAEDPRRWRDAADVQTLIYRTSWNGHPDSERDADTPVMRAFFRRYDETGDDAGALEFAQRFARVFAPEYTIDVSSQAGYSQSDWWLLVTVVRDGCGTPEAYSDIFGQYLRGDVYIVMVEYRTVCGYYSEHWDAVNPYGVDADTLGGIYADDAEDAVKQYLELN